MSRPLSPDEERIAKVMYHIHETYGGLEGLIYLSAIVIARLQHDSFTRSQSTDRRTS